ncbi:MAG: hypothetical protein K2I71_03955, partial [Helicobacter sp.]|nr:hypothetical protein [Helicobacter sp.]
MKKYTLLMVTFPLFATEYNGILTGDLQSTNGVDRTDNFIYECTKLGCSFNSRSVNSSLRYDGKNQGGILTVQGKHPVNTPQLLPQGSRSTLLYLNDGDIDVKNGHLKVKDITGMAAGLRNIKITNATFEWESDRPGEKVGGINFKDEFTLINAKFITHDISSFGSTGFIDPNNHSINIDKDSTLEIKNGDTFISYKSLDNKGVIIFEGNTFVSLGNDQNLQWTLGAKIGQTATLNNTGIIKIKGDFWNGGERSLSKNTKVTCVLGGCGASNLTNEGTIEVDGDFYNKQGDGLKSSVELKGGVLKAKNFINENGNTLKFSANYAQEMGKLDGNLKNQGGIVAVDIVGADLNRDYTFITGNVSGLSVKDLQITSSGKPNDLIAWDLTNDGRGFALYPAGVDPILAPSTVGNQNSGNEIVPTPPNSGNETVSIPPKKITMTKYDSLKNSLGGNKKAVLNTIDSKIANFVTFGGSEYVTSVANDVDNNVNSEFIVSPKIMLDALKLSRNFKPVIKIDAIKANATANILSDALTIPITMNSHEQLDVSGFGLGVRGGDN